MQPYIRVTGLVAPLDRVNVDTDQIIPKQFLKRVERSGFGQFLFYDWRHHSDGTRNADFVLNRPEYETASILLARDNFGCGSSREHAAWSLLDGGFRTVLAPSFADIFYNNCFKNGVLPVALSETAINALFVTAGQGPLTVTVDLERQVVSDGEVEYSFDVDPFRRTMMLEGLDDIGLTLTYDQEIAAYEERRRSVDGSASEWAAGAISARLNRL